MNQRVQRLKKRLEVEKYPICVEKARIVVDTYKQMEGQPVIERRAMATANYLDNKKIFIEDDELIVGNIASKPMGMEACSWGPAWTKEDMDDLKLGNLEISDEDEAVLRSMDDYWEGKGRTLEERLGQFYDDDRLWPFLKSGILCPPWEKKTEGRGRGAAGIGWGMGVGLTTLIIPDFAKVINEGLNKTIKEAEEELKNLRYVTADDIRKGEFLRSVLIALPAVVRIAERFGDLAEKMAAKEKNAARKKELLEIAETCKWVPGNPARTFREAMQSFWFYWLMSGCGTTPGGRFDQFMYPYYKKDKAEGKLNDDDVLELLECLRVKVMQLNFVGGGKLQRQKWAGMARWHNWVIGGITPDGKDATNELSYLILDAAKDCQTPHHTITVRVAESTPESLMLKALEVVKTGMGMPAFVGDKSYVEYLTGQGVPLRDARDYALAGCLDVNLPGKSRIFAFGMFVVPRVFEITMNNGFDPRLKIQLGPKTGEFESFKTYEDFMKAFKEQLKYFMGLVVEEHNILMATQSELFPDAVQSALMDNAIKVGRDALDRELPFENNSALNLVGMVNVADSMAGLKKLVFDEKKVSKKEMKDALAANWQGNGYADIRKMCLAAPKFGNGDPYVDSIAAELFQYWADTAVTFKSRWGGTVKPTGISITAHAPGGAMTGATPDGRLAGDTFADGSMSPGQGMDTSGPTAVMRSAMAVNQIPYQATLLNMKFHPSALKTEEEMKKLTALIKTYFSQGGKHVQFNVINKLMLVEAQEKPKDHRDLIVRVAGYSAFFVNLGAPVQNEIIARTEHHSAA